MTTCTNKTELNHALKAWFLCGKLFFSYPQFKGPLVRTGELGFESVIAPIHVFWGYSLSTPENMTRVCFTESWRRNRLSEGFIGQVIWDLCLWVGLLRLWVLVLVRTVFRLGLVIVLVVRVRLVVGVPYLLILLSDELLCLGVRHSGHHGDGEVCAALPR